MQKKDKMILLYGGLIALVISASFFVIDRIAPNDLSEEEKQFRTEVYEFIAKERKGQPPELEGLFPPELNQTSILDNEFFLIKTRAAALMEERKYEEAIVEYDIILSIYPYDLEANQNKAFALRKIGQLEESYLWYENATKILQMEKNTVIGAKASNLFELEKYVEAIEWYEKHLENNPEDENVLTLIKINSALHGSQLNDNGNHVEAIIWYDKALEIDPEYDYALKEKGRAYFNLQKYDEAILWLDKSLAIDPTSAAVTELKGTSLLQQRKPMEAITWFDKSLTLDPFWVNALTGKGISLIIIGNFEGALMNFDSALSIDPNNVFSLTFKSMILAEHGNYVEALSLVNKAIEIDPNYTLAKNWKNELLGR